MQDYREPACLGEYASSYKITLKLRLPFKTADSYLLGSNLEHEFPRFYPATLPVRLVVIDMENRGNDTHIAWV